MLLGITRFEIRYQLKNPVFWVAIAVFFLLGFGLTASEKVNIGTPGAVFENSPYAIATAIAVFTLLYLFMITAFVADAIVRDDTSGFAPIVRATSVTKAQIVLGRLLGGLIIAWLGYLAVPMGMAAGASMPWVDPQTIGPQKLAYYLWNYFVFAVPNILLTSAILFALATIVRSLMASEIGAVVLAMVYVVTVSAAGQNIAYRETFARFDPLGNGALRETTRYWTQADLNGQLVNLSGVLLFNRLFVIVLAIALIALTIWRFSMTERAPSMRQVRKMARSDARNTKLNSISPLLNGGFVIARTLSPARLVQFYSRLRVEVRQVLISPGLIVLALFTIVSTAAALWLGRSVYGTLEHPTLAATITVVRSNSAAVIIMIAVVYGGELVWRERDRKVNEIIDSTPVPSWMMTVPKILAISVVLLILNLVAMATGIVTQAFQGSTQLGLAQYFGWFIIPAAIDGLLISVLVVLAQVLSPNKNVGWGIVFLWFVGSIFLESIGFANPLYTYGASPTVPLSDFAGAGSFWKGALILKFYWACCAVIFGVVAHLLWPRGTDLGLKVRARRAFNARNPIPLTIAGVAAVGMIATGAYAYYNIKRLNRYEVSAETEVFLANVERKYLKYENLPRPVVTNVVLNAQLYPQERRLRVTGGYVLRNDTNIAMREVHVRSGERDIEWLRLDIAGAKLASSDPSLGYRIYRFDTPLAPGATTRLGFVSQIWRRGFRSGAPATDILENGTFSNNNQFAPIIGMNRQGLLTDGAQRRRQGLPSELRMAKLEDVAAAKRNYLGVDWVMSDISVTTDVGQTPIAPGNLISDTTTGNRRTARFVSPSPILNFFAIQSAEYQIARRQHFGINLSVYFQRGHEWNVPKMLKAMASSLDYYRSNFGPYQFNHARIIEFPGYSSFAQAFAGTMPYSESIGFNANTNDPNKIDFTTYVVAHEMAHQYWAHQVIGADVQGGTLTSETLAQYSALMVMKKLYGRDQVRRFLKYELDSYLSARKTEAVEELPLDRVENQGYVHYRKGSLVMYLLQERLGEAEVNRALARFVAEFRFKGAPYHRSTDLISELRKEAKTAAEQQLITDLFSRITLYDLKVTGAATRASGDEWITTLTIAADKYISSGKGVESKISLDEKIEVGLFTARPGLQSFKSEDVVLMNLVPIRSGVQKIQFRTKVKPTSAGVDPYSYYIDRNSDDNVKDVTGSK